jgi:16S rRNA processing protein RimM
MSVIGAFRILGRQSYKPRRKNQTFPSEKGATKPGTMTGSGKKLVIVGVILGAHGVRGDVRIRSLTDVPEELFAMGPLRGADGEVLVTPDRHRAARTHFIVTPRENRQKEAWDDMKGTQLHVQRNQFPDPEDEDIYIEDLVGLQVVDPDGHALGTVHAVLNHGASDLIEIALSSGARALIPFTFADVPTIDLEDGTLVVATLELWTAATDDTPEAD